MRVTTHKEAYIRLSVKSGAPRALWFRVFKFIGFTESFTLYLYAQ